jgi:RNase P/RNase MRP subunit POP5
LATQRENKHYLAFKILSKANITDFRAVDNAITASLAGLIGSIGMAEAGLHALNEQWDAAKQQGILAISPRYTNALKASLTFIKAFNNYEAVVMSTAVSGTIKKALLRRTAS